MKNISIISALIFFAALAFAENNIDLISMSKVSNELCELQIEFNEVVERLTPKGQKIVRSLVFDFQNELFQSHLFPKRSEWKYNNLLLLAAD